MSIRAITFNRSVRGATQLTVFEPNAVKLRRDLELIERQVGWRVLPNATGWAEICLSKANSALAVLSTSSAIQEIVEAFGERPTHITLKQLDVGGFVKPHRDIRGSIPVGSLRVHVPIITHPAAYMVINGTRMHLREGEIWVLDTSYRHAVYNASPQRRVHLVIDFPLTPRLRSLLPSPDVRDKLHEFYFALVCAAKGVATLAEPRLLQQRVREIVRLWN